MNKRSFLKKATNSFVGRVLRRLLGEEKGAVMMEYIVVGLLIAAVAVVAIGVFGNTASGLFGTLTHVLRGAPTDARAKLKEVDKNALDGAKNANSHSNKILADGDYSDQAEEGSLNRE